MKKDGFSPLYEQDDFFMFPKHQEMLGSEAQNCGISFLLEWTGTETERPGDLTVDYILYRYNNLCVTKHLSACMCQVLSYFIVLFLGGLHLISFKAAA